jgi:hypothetical protein
VVLLRLLGLCVAMNYSACGSVGLQMAVRCTDNTHSGRHMQSNAY